MRAKERSERPSGPFKARLSRVETGLIGLLGSAYTRNLGMVAAISNHGGGRVVAIIR